MALRLITGPTVEPITLAQAKAHLRVDHTDDDLWITAAIIGCRVYAENFMGRALVSQTWELVIDEFPDDGDIKLPKSPLRSVVSIKYDDAAGVETTMSTLDYYVDTASEPGWVVVANDWPTTLDSINTVRIQFVAGYAPSADSPDNLVANIPQSIINGILLHLGFMYANRESVVVGTTVAAIPWGGVDELYRQYRVEISMA